MRQDNRMTSRELVEDDIDEWGLEEDEWGITA